MLGKIYRRGCFALLLPLVFGLFTGLMPAAQASAAHTPIVYQHCLIADQGFEFVHRGAAAGWDNWTLVDTNLEAQPCTLRGYPRIKLMGLGGQLGHRFTHSPGKIVTLVLKPGEQASAEFAVADHTLFPGCTGEHVTWASFLRVKYHRHSPGRADLTFGMFACSGIPHYRPGTVLPWFHISGILDSQAKGTVRSSA